MNVKYKKKQVSLLAKVVVWAICFFIGLAVGTLAGFMLMDVLVGATTTALVTWALLDGAINGGCND